MACWRLRSSTPEQRAPGSRSTQGRQAPNQSINQSINQYIKQTSIMFFFFLGGGGGGITSLKIKYLDVKNWVIL